MKTNRWFYRMLLSYLPVFLVSITLVMVLSLASLGIVSKRMALKMNEAYTNYAMEVIDGTLHSIEQLIYKEIETNSKLKQFFYHSQWDNTYYTIREPSQKMLEIITTIPMIDSIYLIRIDDNTVLSQNMSSSLDQFGDKAFIESMIGRNFPELWTSRRTFSEFPGQEKQKTVVSLVKRVPQISGGQGMVVVNVNTDEIEKIIAGLTHSDTVYFKLADGDGHLLNSSGAAGDLPAETAEAAKTLSKVKSDYTGWEIYSGLKNAGQFDFVIRSTYISGLAGIAALVIGMVWIIIVTRRNYKPIESITARIQAYIDEKNGSPLESPQKDEFQFIESTMDRMIEQSHRHMAEQQKYMSLKRQSDIRHLFEGGERLPIEEWRTSGIWNPAWEQGSSIVALVEIDHAYTFNRTYSGQDKLLFKFALANVLKEIAETRFSEVWAEWITDRCLGAVYFGPNGNGSTIFSEQCAAMQEQLREWTANNLPFTVTIAIGEAVSSLSEIPASYSAAQKALSYKASLGCNRLINHGVNNGNTAGEVYEHLQTIRTIARSFMLGEAWRDDLTRLFEQLGGGMFSNEDFRSLADYFQYHIRMEVMKLPEEYQAVWQQVYSAQLTELLEQSESFGELLPTLESLLEAAHQELALLRESRGKFALSRKMRAYIDEHFSNPDLSLVHLSEAFGVSSKYVSQLFKEENGENFVDYLAYVRMEKAKRLLVETDMKVQDISAEVGYMHTFSFTRVFKKTVGMTPGEYRKQREG
ncbi:helix-turn-helix domain-containing protein [Paenibacillus thalictri]|uniref:AraC family transcriptional regulator n=1 Tax=Paenibacillus thalictri TaxID=2527873 RepID=A0A4Q9DG48_9BACL|nr:helix-turn-helix domain-containing protein [Paenibacillus thalictri]TBL69389.1 AraC family transcriptional regulator [Paenibacillus thalictri]